MAFAERWNEFERRLEDDEIAALDAVFGGTEAAVGVRTNHGAMVDRMAGLCRGSRPMDAMAPVEYWACWSIRDRRRPGLVAYRALKSMVATREGASLVSVLYRVYGPRPPGPAFDEIKQLGELGRIAAFTDVAEEVATRTGAQSIAGAVAAVLFPRPESSSKANEHERTLLLRRLRAEADELLSAAVIAFRQACRDTKERDHGH